MSRGHWQRYSATAEAGKHAHGRAGERPGWPPKPNLSSNPQTTGPRVDRQAEKHAPQELLSHVGVNGRQREERAAACQQLFQKVHARAKHAAPAQGVEKGNDQRGILREFIGCDRRLRRVVSTGDETREGVRHGVEGRRGPCPGQQARVTYLEAELSVDVAENLDGHGCTMERKEWWAWRLGWREHDTIQQQPLQPAYGQGGARGRAVSR